MVKLVKPADDRLLQHDAKRADDQRRQDQRGEIPDPNIVQQHPGRERAHHEQRAMREVDDVEHAEDDRQPKRQASRRTRR